jgi:hypothetical protein
MLLWNCHITADGKPRVEWPSSRDLIPPDVDALVMFDISSEIPETARGVFEVETGRRLEGGARGYLLNADQVNLSRFITFGTRVGFALPSPQGGAAPSGERYSDR